MRIPILSWIADFFMGFFRRIIHTEVPKEDVDAIKGMLGWAGKTAFSKTWKTAKGLRNIFRREKGEKTTVKLKGKHKDLRTLAKSLAEGATLDQKSSEELTLMELDAAREEKIIFAEAADIMEISQLAESDSARQIAHEVSIYHLANAILQEVGEFAAALKQGSAQNNAQWDELIKNLGNKIATQLASIVVEEKHDEKEVNLEQFKLKEVLERLLNDEALFARLNRKSKQYASHFKRIRSKSSLDLSKAIAEKLTKMKNAQRSGDLQRLESSYRALDKKIQEYNRYLLDESNKCIASHRIIRKRIKQMKGAITSSQKDVLSTRQNTKDFKKHIREMDKTEKAIYAHKLTLLNDPSTALAFGTNVSPLIDTFFLHIIKALQTQTSFCDIIGHALEELKNLCYAGAKTTLELHNLISHYEKLTQSSAKLEELQEGFLKQMNSDFEVNLSALESLHKTKLEELQDIRIEDDVLRTAYTALRKARNSVKGAQSTVLDHKTKLETEIKIYVTLRSKLRGLLSHATLNYINHQVTQNEQMIKTLSQTPSAAA